MAISDIGIKLSLEGVSSVQGGLSQVSGQLGELDGGAMRVGDAFNRLGGVGASVVGSLKTAFVGIFGVVGAMQLSREFVQMADAMTLLNARLRLATGGGDEFLQSQRAIYQIAQANGGALQETTTLYTKLLEPVKRLGGGVKENTAIVEAFSSALRVGGASTQEAASATLQFAQAMASGKLSGDEFRSLAEASPRFMRALADGMGVPIEALKTMGTEGKLTADVVGNALIKQLGALRDEAQQMPDTVGAAFQRMKNDVALMVDEVNTAQGVTQGLAELLGVANGVVLSIAQAFRTWGSSTRDASSGLDSMSIIAAAAGTVLETLIVLASDVAFVFKSMGREIGGIAAQFSAMGAAGGVFTSEGRAAWTQVGNMMKEDAAAARLELDRFQASVVGATSRVLQQRDAIKNHSLSAEENRNELDRLGKQQGVTGQKTLELNAATKQAKESVDQAAKAGQDYLASLNAQFAAMNQQISLGRELTKTESEILKLEEEVRAGKKKLTDQELESARAKLLEMDAMREQVAQIKEGEKATLAAIAAREKEYAAALQNTENLREQLLAQEAANLTAQTGVDYTGQLTVAKLRDAAATADRNAILAMERQENDVLADQYRQQAAGLRALADAKEQGIHIKAAQEANAEWGRVTDSINNGLTDALMRAFESGKGFFEAFKSTLVNAFKTMVLQPTIKAIMAPVSGAIGSMLGFGNAAASTGAAGSAGAGLGSLLSSGMNFLSGGTISGAALNLVNSGLGQTLGLSSLQNIGGNMIAGPTGLGSMLGSGMGMLGNGFAGYGISKALSGGYSAGGAVNTIAGIASAIPGIGPIAGIVGGLVNRAFGRKAKEIKDYGLEGSITGGDATGRTYQDWFQKGGWFRSNKSGTDYSAMADDMAAALDLGAKGVLEQTKAWAAALKLPADSLASVTANFKVKLTDDEKANKEAIELIFEGYSNALTQRFEAVLAPLQAAGEKVADTMARLASLAGFSDSINQLGGIFSTVASSSIAARENIIALAGGIDQLMAKAGQFVQDYYTTGEQAGLQARDTLELFKAIGIDGSGITSREDFRRLVESVDVSTKAGQEQLVALLNIAPQFAQLADYIKEQKTTLDEVAKQAPVVAVLDQMLPEQISTTEAVSDVSARIQEGNAVLTAIESAIKEGNVSIATGLAALATATQNVAALQAQVAASTAATAKAVSSTATDAALANSAPSYTYDIGSNYLVSAGN